MKSAPVTQEGGGRGRPVGVETLLRFPGRRNELIAHFPRSDESWSLRSSWTSFFSNPDVLVRCTRTLLMTSFSH